MCAKVRYPSQREAAKALTRLLRKRAVEGQIEKFEERSYRCPECQGWHLTSKRLSGR